MKAAVVFDLAEGPVWADFIDPQPAPGQTIIDVRAAALSHVAVSYTHLTLPTICSV